MKKVFFAILTTVVLIVMMTTSVVACDGKINAAVSSEDCDGFTVTASPTTEYQDERGHGNTKWYAAKWEPTSILGTGTFPWIDHQEHATVEVTVTWTKFTRSGATSPWVNTGVTEKNSQKVKAYKPGNCGCTTKTPEPTATPTATEVPPTPTFTPTNTEVPPTPTFTPTDEPTTTPTEEPTPTDEPTKEPTPTNVPTATPTTVPPGPCAEPKKCGPTVLDRLNNLIDVFRVNFVDGGFGKGCGHEGCPVNKEQWGLYVTLKQIFFETSSSLERLEAANVPYRQETIDGYKHTYIDQTQLLGEDGTAYWVAKLPVSLVPDNCINGFNCWNGLYPGVGDNLVVYDAATGKLYADLYGPESLVNSRTSACSVTVNPWNISPDGIASTALGGTTSYEWQQLALNRGCSNDIATQFSIDLWNSPDGTLKLPDCARLK
jgi:hypothetical protein